MLLFCLAGSFWSCFPNAKESMSCISFSLSNMLIKHHSCLCITFSYCSASDIRNALMQNLPLLFPASHRIFKIICKNAFISSLNLSIKLPLLPAVICWAYLPHLSFLPVPPSFTPSSLYAENWKPSTAPRAQPAEVAWATKTQELDM